MYIGPLMEDVHALTLFPNCLQPPFHLCHGVSTSDLVAVFQEER